MASQIELNPVSHFTIATVGPPGERTFYMQGARGSETISLIIEKEQAAALSANLEAFLEKLDREYPRRKAAAGDEVLRDMRLREPVEALFRVGNMGYGYNDEADQVVIVAYELVGEDEEANAVSFWMSRELAEQVTRHAMDVVRAGRPICGNCGRPIDADGHFCPQRNGHRQ